MLEEIINTIDAIGEVREGLPKPETRVTEEGFLLTKNESVPGHWHCERHVCPTHGTTLLREFHLGPKTKYCCAWPGCWMPLARFVEPSERKGKPSA